MSFRLPLTLVCKEVEPSKNGSPIKLSCVVTDAEGEVVRSKDHLVINISSTADYEEASMILQSYANNITKECVARGEAERGEVTEEDRVEEMSSIMNREFVGVTK